MTNDEIDTDDVQSGTISAEYDQLDQIAGLIRRGLGSDPYLTTDKMTIETENTKLEITAEDDQIKVREVD